MSLQVLSKDALINRLRNEAKNLNETIVNMQARLVAINDMRHIVESFPHMIIAADDIILQSKEKR
jgi:hypothetical protein